MLSPTLFLNGVLGLIRIGREARETYKEYILRGETLSYFAPDFSSEVLTGKDARVWAAEYIRTRTSSRYYEELFVEEHGAPQPRFPVDAPEWDRAIEAVCREKGLFTPKEIPPGGLPVSVHSPVIVLTHHEWMKNQASPWARFGITVADIALDFVSQEPELLGPNGIGLGKDARRVANALLPNLAQALRPELYRGGEKGVGEFLGEALFQSALETIVESPDLVTTQEHWQPIVEAAVGSVNTQVQQTLSAGETLFARDRVAAFVQGPFVQSVVKAVDNNSDALLKGSFKDNRFLGQVSRTLLGHLAELTPEDARLQEYFSPRGAALIFDSALQTLADRPDLVIRGEGEGVERSRQFLTTVMTMVQSAPRPFNTRDVATDIGLAVLDIAQDYALAQVMADPGDDDWDVVMADLAQNMIGEIFAGFSDAIAWRGDMPSESRLLERIFSRPQAISLIKMIAGHIAATPGLVVGQGGSPEVRNIARGIASFIADDSNNLLSGVQWRQVISLSLELAAKNPGALFDIDTEGNQGNSIAVAVIGDLLNLANTQIVPGGPVRRPGLILVGETLQQTIESTLQAASALALKGLNAEEGSATHEAVRDFAARLLQLAQGDATGVSLSAADWVDIYRTFIAEVMEKGLNALDENSPDYIQDGDLLAILYEISPGSDAG